MKKPLLVTCCILFLLTEFSVAQTSEWAFTMNLPQRSEAAAVKQDQSKNFYVASFTKSTTANHSSQLGKRRSNSCPDFNDKSF